MKWIPVFGLTLFGWMMTAALPAAELTVAVVNFQEVLMAHPQAKELVTRLKTEGDKAATELAALAKRFEELEKEYQALQGKKGDGKFSVLTQAQIKRRMEIQEEAMKIQADTARINGENRVDMNKERVTGLTTIANEVQKLVKKANGGRYALVFDTSAMSRDGYPQLLDFPGADDITQEVIKLLPKE